MLFVVGNLFFAAAEGFVHGLAHGGGDFVGVEDNGAVYVSGSAARGLGERPTTAQKAFFVGIENGHKRHFGQIEAFAQ